MYKLTDEMYAIIEANEACVPVIGYAGATKTSTLIEKANQVCNKQVQYIAFNDSMVKEARERFGRNTKCKTMHSLAFRQFGSRYANANQLRNMSYRDIGKASGEASWSAISSVKSTLETFLGSAEAHILTSHVPGNASTQSKGRIVTAANDVWQQMQNLDSNIPMSHDGYLKLFQMSRPRLSCDIVMLDEAQDANPIFMSIALEQVNQGKQLFVIGDPHQQIYRFRGAVNAFDHPALASYKTRYLSQSFRFGSTLANLSSFLLASVGEKVPLRGFQERQTVIGNDCITLDSSIEKGTAAISRTVAGTLDMAIKLLNLFKGASVQWIGGIENYKMQDILDVFHLSTKDFGMIENRNLTKDYPTYAEYSEIAEATTDPEMMKTIRLIDNYGQRLPELIRGLRKSHNQPTPDFFVGTAHRTKGLDFDNVLMNDDFPNPVEELRAAKQKKGKITKQDMNRYVDEVNLLYVGATRAKFKCAYAPSIDAMKKDLIKPKTAVAQPSPGFVL